MVGPPRVIVCDQLLLDYFGALLDDFAPPPFWDAPDPTARLREIGGEARVLITYGGNPRLPGLVEALPSLAAVLVVAVADALSPGEEPV